MDQDISHHLLNWRSRELALKIQVLQTHLAIVKEDKRVTQDAIERIMESMNADDKLLKQKANLEHWVMEKTIRLTKLRDDLKGLKESSHLKARNMLHDLCDIYPIIEFPDRRGYSICDIHLPNKDNLDGHDETMVSVAIGYVCHLLILTSEFLDMSLRFPIRYNGSKSTIYCCAMDQTYPLYIESFKNKEWPNFCSGLKLLNLDIVQLRALFGLATKEPDDMLANLHDLNYFLLRT